jgi:hypothetical protein
MFHLLQVLAVILVAAAMGLALAHALELPGKMRLTKEAYYAMQPIYYPGFTIGGGIAEAGGILTTILLVCLTPSGSAAFWLTLAAVLGLLGMEAVYWLWTHPVNQFWLEGEKLGDLGARFFSFGIQRSRLQNGTRPADWTAWRDRWEYSHVARAGLALASLITLVSAIAVQCQS